MGFSVLLIETTTLAELLRLLREPCLAGGPGRPYGSWSRSSLISPARPPLARPGYGPECGRRPPFLPLFAIVSPWTPPVIVMTAFEDGSQTAVPAQSGPTAHQETVRGQLGPWTTSCRHHHLVAANADEPAAEPTRDVNGIRDWPASHSGDPRQTGIHADAQGGHSKTMKASAIAADLEVQGDH